MNHNFRDAIRIAEWNQGNREKDILSRLKTITIDKEDSDFYHFIAFPDNDGHSDSFTVSISHNAIVG